MTLAQIIKLALSQLDEDLEDAMDYDELLKMYANQGYQIAAETYYKPKLRVDVKSDDNGFIDRLSWLGEGKVYEIHDMQGRYTPYHMTLDGTMIRVPGRNAQYYVYVEEKYPMLVEGSDVPRIPETAHPGLVDYVCYKFLFNGNAAKQQRAAVYQQEFVRAMQRIVPQGSGSVTHTHGLYAATDIRCGRG